MLPLPEFLDPTSYQVSTEGADVVIISCLVAAGFSIYVAILSYRSALRSQSSAFLWCGNFALLYAFWNIFFLSHFAQRDLEIFSTTVTTHFTQRAYLALGVLLPSLAHACIIRIYQARYLVTNRLHFFNILFALGIFFVPQSFPILYLTALYAALSFGGLSLINLKIWRRYKRAHDLRLKTRSLFLAVGMSASIVLSFLGQARAEFAPGWPIPYLGNITTVFFIFFIYKMIANPRLREIRELMIKSGRLIALAIVLSGILILLLIWVGDNKAELFFFNTFLASFIILYILAPLESQVDRFILSKISSEKVAFQNTVQAASRRIKRARTSKQLASNLIKAVKDSERIYQTALYLLDQSTQSFRLAHKTSMQVPKILKYEDDSLLQLFASSPRKYIQEGAEDSEEFRVLREKRAHLVFAIHSEKKLVGLWLIRSSLSSDSAFASFSFSEIESLSRLTQEFSGMLEQLNYFEKHDQQQRLAALGEMSAALAHEIRNPLGAIQGATSLLETSPHISNDEDQECVKILKSEIERLQATVDQYLHFARKNEREETVFLRDIMQKSLDAAASKSKRSQTNLIGEGMDSDLMILTDRLKLEQVLINLLVNACEAFAKTVWLSVRQDSKRLVISVRDDGPGIPSAVLPNIFTPLFTTKRAGSGLGLPICKKIIDSLGGELKVQSEAKKGTEFLISFPIQMLSEAKKAVSEDTPPSL